MTEEKEDLDAGAITVRAWTVDGANKSLLSQAGGAMAESAKEHRVEARRLRRHGCPDRASDLEAGAAGLSELSQRCILASWGDKAKRGADGGR